MDKPGVVLDDRLGDREERKNSDGETEREVSAMLEDYNMGLTDREDDISPPKLELASQFRPRHSPPLPHTMDISSVRFRPVLVMAQAVLTSTYSHPRQELPEVGKVNIDTLIQ